MSQTTTMAFVWGGILTGKRGRTAIKREILEGKREILEG